MSLVLFFKELFEWLRMNMYNLGISGLKIKAGYIMQTAKEKT